MRLAVGIVADQSEVLDAITALGLPEARHADAVLAVMRAFRLIQSSRETTNQPAARPTREA